MNAFQGLPDIANVTPRGPADDALFADIAAVLAKHDALDRFGVTLLHTHYPIADGEVLLEQTDVAARVQTIAPVLGQPADIIETAWRLGPDGQAIVNCICPTDIRTGEHKGDHIKTGG
jgi:hypothetical protein